MLFSAFHKCHNHRGYKDASLGDSLTSFSLEKHGAMQGENYL